MDWKDVPPCHFDLSFHVTPSERRPPAAEAQASSSLCHFVPFHLSHSLFLSNTGVQRGQLRPPCLVPLAPSVPAAALAFAKTQTCADFLLWIFPMCPCQGHFSITAWSQAFLSPPRAVESGVLYALPFCHPVVGVFPWWQVIGMEITCLCVHMAGVWGKWALSDFPTTR